MLLSVQFSGEKMKLSIVTTLYKSESHVSEFCDRAAAAAKTLNQNYEIILVNDGSPDNSLLIAKRYADDHANVKIIDLSRNFGHHKAIMTGLQHSCGDFVFLLDGDLEEEPEWLVTFWQILNECGVDVVYGVQEKRRGSLFERLSGYLYYNLFRTFSGLQIPFNVVTARLMTRRYVNALTRYKEREVDITGLWMITGFDQTACPVTKHSSSSTTYTFARKLDLFINTITSFSNLPLIAIFYFGLLISIIAIVFIGFLLVYWYFLDAPLTGWTSLIASIWLLGGLIISFVGIIGIYLAKVFSETKRRPNTIVREIYPFSASKRQ
jgi:putative glycosyltransferase